MRPPRQTINTDLGGSFREPPRMLRTHSLESSIVIAQSSMVPTLRPDSFAAEAVTGGGVAAGGAGTAAVTAKAGGGPAPAAALALALAAFSPAASVFCRLASFGVSPAAGCLLPALGARPNINIGTSFFGSFCGSGFGACGGSPVNAAQPFACSMKQASSAPRSFFDGDAAT